MFASQQAIRRPNPWQVAAAAVLIVLGLVVGLIVSSALPAGPHGQLPGTVNAPGTGDPADSALADYRQTVANLAVAVERHDMPSVARFKLQLDRQITLESIQAIYAERSHLLANLAAAEERHDQRMAAEFRQRISALCPAVQVNNEPAFCQ